MRKIFLGLLSALLLMPALARAGSAPPYGPPFGLMQMPPNLFGSAPFNLASMSFVPGRNTQAQLLAALDGARANKMHVIVEMMDFANLGENPDGSFSLANWQARYNQWCPAGHCVDLHSYVADGTLIALHIFEYSSPLNPVKNEAPTLDQIRQVAAYVKTLWPYLPIALDSSHPCLLTAEPWSRADVDMVLISFVSTKLPDFARGEARFNQNVACAKQAGLQYVLISNPFGATQMGLVPTGLASFRHFTEYALLYPGKKATFIWRWFPDNTPRVGNGRQTFANFWSEQLDPGVGAAMREIENCAANPTPANCPAGQPGGMAQSNL
jgi:hypothetical protein